MYRICTIILLFNIYDRTSAATKCTTRGRFPNNLNLDCRGYTMCLIGASGISNYDLLCPEYSVYSHLENQCTNVTNYQCLPDYNCQQEGYFKNPASENCTTYIACVKDLNNITTARLISCQPNEVFSITEITCVNETLHKCNNLNRESPEVLHVAIDNFPELSVNKVSCTSSVYSTMIIYFTSVIVLK